MVVTDMDGTLLDSENRIPESFWPVLEQMRERGILFVPASGRQYHTLASQFPQEGLGFIAENGTFVVLDGTEISSSPVDRPTAHDVVEIVRGAAHRDLGLVLCGKDAAYIERTDEAFLGETELYYASLRRVTDLLEVEEEFLKIAVFDFDDSATGAYPLVKHLDSTHQVAVSSAHWLDIMADGVNKGQGVRALQAARGIAPEQTVVFGDYLNDLEMLDEAYYSYAMSNAHPDILERARFTAPSHAENGVVSVLHGLLSGTRA